MASASESSSVESVVLLHGVYDPGDTAGPFRDLLAVEQFLQQRGVTPVRSQWSENFNQLLALAHRRRSFADELARSLDAELRGRLLPAIAGKRWALLGHSGGGLTIYQWLVAYAAQFARDLQIVPELIVTLAAPYQCSAEIIRFHGRDYPVHEQPIAPREIVEAVPRQLLILIAGQDDVLVSVGDTDDVTIPAEIPLGDKVVQYLIEDATHSGICSHPDTLSLIADYL